MNGIVVIDKPAGWTSHDVIAKLRGILREKRIGHSGTLDPMATGVLLVFIGRATRAVEFSQSQDKAYEAGLRLGLVTDTQDITGTVLETRPVTVDILDVEKTAKLFTGPQLQLPPMYSAVKVGGKKLYELARRGVEAERKPRQITIESIEVLGKKDSDYQLRVVCSKGTYIRTLCHDLGQALGCGATMSSLRRIRSGSFTLSEAVGIGDLEAAVSAGRIDDFLKPLDSLFSQYPALVIDGEKKKKCLNGAAFAVNAGSGLYRVYDESGSFLMLGQSDGQIMHTVKSFFSV